MSFLVFAVFANPLPIDQAFVFSAALKGQSLMLDWKIQPGYQLYRNSIRIKIQKGSQVTLGQYALPLGIQKQDIIRSHYQAFENALSLSIPLKRKKGDLLLLSVTYQGCRSHDYCYAPVRKQIKLYLNQQKAQVSSAQPLQVRSFLSKTNAFWQLLIFFGLGVLLAFTPCVLPMIPILSSLIVSQEKTMTMRKAFLLSLVYVLAMAVTYAIAGLVLGLLGASIQTALQLPWVIILFSIVFVLLGFSLFGCYEIRLPIFLENALNKLTRKQKRGHYIGVAAMGVLSALIVSPCVSAPLIGALAYITDKGDVWMGVASLFLLGLGMGVPLLIVGVSAGNVLPRAGKWMDEIKALFGFVLFGLAIYMLGRLLPGSVTLFLWGCLLLLASLIFAFSKTTLSIARKLEKLILILVFIYGVILIIGSLSGHDEFFAPLGRYERLSGLQFETVTTAAQLNRVLQVAKKQGKPVLLDFSARWCVECAELKQYTFSNVGVKRALESYRLIEVDLTKNDKYAVALKKRYNVVGTPTLIFLDKGGQFLPEFSSVGFVSARNFLALLARVNRGNEN